MVGPSQTAPNRNFTSQLHVVTAFKHFPFLSSPKMKWDFQPASGSRRAFPECTWGMQLSTAKLLPCQCQSCRRERGDWAHHNKPGSCACRQAQIINHGPEGREKIQQTGELLTCATRGLLQTLCIGSVTQNHLSLQNGWNVLKSLFVCLQSKTTKRTTMKEIFFSPLTNTKTSPPALLFLGATTKYNKFTFTLDNQSIAVPAL